MPEPGRRVALRVEVDDEDPVARARRARRRGSPRSSSCRRRPSGWRSRGPAAASSARRRSPRARRPGARGSGSGSSRVRSAAGSLDSGRDGAASPVGSASVAGAGCAEAGAASGGVASAGGHRLAAGVGDGSAWHRVTRASSTAPGLADVRARDSDDPRMPNQRRRPRRSAHPLPCCLHVRGRPPARVEYRVATLGRRERSTWNNGAERTTRGSRDTHPSPGSRESSSVRTFHVEPRRPVTSAGA